MTIASPSEVARLKSACDDMAFEAIYEALDLAASCAVSGREAAYRGNRQLLESHLRELRLCILTAFEAHKRLSKSEGGRIA